MAERRLKKTHLLIYKMVPGCELKDVLSPNNDLIEGEMAGMPKGARLYYKIADKNKPSWMDTFFDGDFERMDAIKDVALSTKTISCVLVVPTGYNGKGDIQESAYFCICFGHGYLYVNKTNIERNFGLILSQKIIDKASISSLNISSFESSPKRKFIQSLNPSEFDNYLLDAAKDNLQKITGRSAYTAEEQLNDCIIGGKDAFCISAAVNKTAVQGFLEKAFRVYKDESITDRVGYKSMYEEVPLNADMIKEIVSALAEHKTLYMSLPDGVDHTTIREVNYLNLPGLEEQSFVTLDFEDIKGFIAPDNFERVMVRIDFESNPAANPPKFSLVECIAGDFKSENEKRNLQIIDGRVYKLSGGFIDYVKNAYSITKLYNNLPDGVEEYIDEDNYNKTISEQNGYLLLDKVNYTVKGHNKLEVCDFMDDKGHLFCVKRKHNSTALGHLFDQVVASSSALLLDTNIDSFNQQIKAACNNDEEKYSKFLIKDFKPDNFTFVFVLLDDNEKCPKGKKPDIPFMAMLSYSECYRRVTSLGFKVLVTGANCKQDKVRANKMKEEKKKALEERKAKEIAEKKTSEKVQI